MQTGNNFSNNFISLNNTPSQFEELAQGKDPLVNSNNHQLSPQAIADFQKTYLEEFNVVLTDDDAVVKGLEFLNFIKLIYKPMPL